MQWAFFVNKAWKTFFQNSGKGGRGSFQAGTNFVFLEIFPAE
jgi:hypothetical protein